MSMSNWIRTSPTTCGQWHMLVIISNSRMYASLVCEQLFKKINGDKNCRKMNEGRFSLFFLYQYDIHNLDIEKKTVLADPRADIRWEFITIVDPKLEEISLQSSEKVVSVDHITETVETMKLDSKFTCPDCKAQYQIEGKFKKHLADVHGNGKKDSICTYCEKVLSSTRALERHLKSHKKCNDCKAEFDSISEANDHMKTHTTCGICKYDFKSKSNLKRHMKDFHLQIV